MSKVSQTELLRYLGAKCEKCGIQENLTVSHIHPTSTGGQNNSKNIQILCRHHHNEYHGIHKKKRDYR